MDFLNLVLIAIAVVGGLATIVLFGDKLRKQGHIDIKTIIIALLSSLILGLYLVFQRSDLPFFFIRLSVLLVAVFSAVALLICGELFLRRADLQTHMGKMLLWFTILMLLLPSVPFWITWALQPSNQPANPASVTLQVYCQALVDNDFARALTYVSDSKTHTSVLSQSDLEQHVQADVKVAGKLRACSSTASDSITSSVGTRHADGSVIYSFRPGVWYFKNYKLFQDPASSTWLIDTEYWQVPHAPGVY